MSDELTIKSHTGPYTVRFIEAVPTDLLERWGPEAHFLVDANVARLYGRPLQTILSQRNTILINATEENKSLQNTVPIFERIVNNSVRRDHFLVAVGGGIVQDITCFIASTLLRGVNWSFVPTTLLAQADSCIGSKSSINLAGAKNILGTFYPPRDVLICTDFLDSLDSGDILSGVGEIIKVHAIAGTAAFERLTADFDRLFDERRVLVEYIRSALHIKQRYIEEDEYDRGIRNIFNYGHSFGHAIESATNYRVPHGIAVTMGMRIANSIAVRRQLLPADKCEKMLPILRKNSEAYSRTEIPTDAFMAALLKDKKNTSKDVRLILPVGPDASIERVAVRPDDEFRSQCVAALTELAE